MYYISSPKKQTAFQLNISTRRSEEVIPIVPCSQVLVFDVPIPIQRTIAVHVPGNSYHSMNYYCPKWSPYNEVDTYQAWLLYGDLSKTNLITIKIIFIFVIKIFHNFKITKSNLESRRAFPNWLILELLQNSTLLNQDKNHMFQTSKILKTDNWNRYNYYDGALPQEVFPRKWHLQPSSQAIFHSSEATLIQKQIWQLNHLL